MTSSSESRATPMLRASAPTRPRERDETDRVAVGDLRRAERLSRRDQLVAGREHGERGPAMDGERAVAADAAAAIVAGDSVVPEASSGSPARRSPPASRMCAPMRDRVEDGDARRQVGHARRRIGLLDGHDRVGAGGHRRAGQDAHRRAGRDRAVGHAPGGGLAGHLEHRPASGMRRPRRPRHARRSHPSPSCPMAAASGGWRAIRPARGPTPRRARPLRQAVAPARRASGHAPPRATAAARRVASGWTCAGAVIVPPLPARPRGAGRRTT